MGGSSASHSSHSLLVSSASSKGGLSASDSGSPLGMSAASSELTHSLHVSSASSNGSLSASNGGSPPSSTNSSELH